MFSKSFPKTWMYCKQFYLSKENIPQIGKTQINGLLYICKWGCLHKGLSCKCLEAGKACNETSNTTRLGKAMHHLKLWKLKLSV